MANGDDYVSVKSLAFFDGGQTIELASPIFERAKPRRRGRRLRRDCFLPNGQPVPTRDELILYILNHVLYQIDPSLGGPMFCKHVIKHNHDRNRDSMYHIVLGCHQWSGVWEIIGNRRMFDVRPFYLPSEQDWIPQIVLSPGNYIGVGNLNGIELNPRTLRRELILRGFVSPEEYDRYTDTSLAGRRQAIREAVRGIWM